MNRRCFVGLMCAVPIAAARNRIDRSRIAVLTDEVAGTPGEAIAFARQYGVEWLELRNVPGQKRHYAELEEPELKAAIREFRESGLKISFLNTGFFKFALPGTEPVRKRKETAGQTRTRLEKDQAAFDNRFEALRKAIRNAQLLGVDRLRVFTFARVAEPHRVEQRVADVLGELERIASREKIRLLIENEASCNVATCAESASLLKLLPSKWIGLNWDPYNAATLKESAFPDGYMRLPRKRIGNVQMKGRSLLDPERRLDWAAIFRTLREDGYAGKVGLETHYFDGTLIEKSHLSMKEILRIVES